jgi:hypothetical protein
VNIQSVRIKVPPLFIAPASPEIPLVSVMFISVSVPLYSMLNIPPVLFAFIIVFPLDFPIIVIFLSMIILVTLLLYVPSSRLIVES